MVYDPVGGELFEKALRSTAWRDEHLLLVLLLEKFPKWQ